GTISRMSPPAIRTSQCHEPCTEKLLREILGRGGASVFRQPAGLRTQFSRLDGFSIARPAPGSLHSRSGLRRWIVYEMARHFFRRCHRPRYLRAADRAEPARLSAYPVFAT